METIHTPKRMLSLTARFGAVVATATFIFVAAGGDAGASSSKFCKDGNNFGNLLNTASGSRVAVVKVRNLAQKVANEAPGSAKTSWNAVAGDFSKALNLSNSSSSAQKKQIEKQITSDIGRAHRSLTKACS